MPQREIEGEFLMGWPDRKRPALTERTDMEGRVVAAQAPVLDLEGLITPTDLSYIHAQLEMPDPIHPQDWSFSVTGEVEHLVQFTLEDLQKLPGRTVRAVTECAGNDTDFFDYLRDGGQKPSRASKWDLAAFARLREMSTDGTMQTSDLDVPGGFMGRLSAGEFTGVPLAAVLEKAGVKPGAVSVRLEGFDRGKPDDLVQYRSAGTTDIEIADTGIINYGKALPMEKALHPDTILAWAQNGEYLRHVHGAPVRLIVPGWSGNWWVKWIQEVEVMDHMPDLYFQTHYFIYADSPDDPDGEMLTTLGVKAVITNPRDEDSPLPAGSHSVRGLAWSGRGAISGVDVSADGGQTWQQAHIEEPRERWLWVRWSYLWEVEEPGQYRIMARATDEEGRVQPQTKWNFQRKHFDGIVPVDVAIT
ncbi:MAG: molybdopterin-dependent oxidoreductase [Dehalococcoidia bacterium]|jgi:DMSO/TMAO reductase YedYZ molybdopterin-dependent catalytic subunit|nr:molybdopterin-dependent oxidoreductase [Dehalococcoidia bacterium]